MLLDSFDLPRPPRPPAALPWTEERLRHLRRRWKQGARAREIGAELGVSANAVIAKIHRLGIARLSPYGGAPNGDIPSEGYMAANWCFNEGHRKVGFFWERGSSGTDRRWLGVARPARPSAAQGTHARHRR